MLSACQNACAHHEGCVGNFKKRCRKFALVEENFRTETAYLKKRKTTGKTAAQCLADSFPVCPQAKKELFRVGRREQLCTFVRVKGHSGQRLPVCRQVCSLDVCSAVAASGQGKSYVWPGVGETEKAGRTYALLQVWAKKRSAVVVCRKLPVCRPAGGEEMTQTQAQEGMCSCVEKAVPGMLKAFCPCLFVMGQAGDESGIELARAGISAAG